eukprot:TRINITY_DN71008_c0_g1_i1.p1 TRINITY_DN71008_c0_g1~~TRINITY_DN71008_c0_g1_i1.p1  ORF type:complete len:204 (-),score=30.89 TRINITY_DN71008_c0_g1_i1:72-683(-)
MSLVTVALAILLINAASAVQFDIGPHHERCLYEDLQKGAGVTLTFEVIFGGFKDIDVYVYDPNSNVLYSQTRQQSGKYSFATEFEGTYRFCLSNQMSTLTKKIVDIAIHVSGTEDKNDDTSDLAKQEHITPLENAVLQLSEGMNAINEDQKYLRAREEENRDINESTNGRVMWWAIFEVATIVGVSVWQIFSLRRFFEVRRSA